METKKQRHTHTLNRSTHCNMDSCRTRKEMTAKQCVPSSRGKYLCVVLPNSALAKLLQVDTTEDGRREQCIDPRAVWRALPQSQSPPVYERITFQNTVCYPC